MEDLDDDMPENDQEIKEENDCEEIEEEVPDQSV